MTAIPEQISVTVEDRRWLRGIKAWRISLAIPANNDLPVLLTALIERQVNATIQGEFAVEVSPAQVVDVKRHRNGQFFLILETCFDQQIEIGPKLTALLGQTCHLNLAPVGVAAQKPCKATTISKDQIAALHSSFFVNPRFQTFIKAKTGDRCEGDQKVTKTAFKQLLGVNSTTDVTPQQMSTILQQFNGWLNAPRA